MFDIVFVLPDDLTNQISEISGFNPVKDLSLFKNLTLEQLLYVAAWFKTGYLAEKKINLVFDVLDSNYNDDGSYTVFYAESNSRLDKLRAYLANKTVCSVPEIQLFVGSYNYEEACEAQNAVADRVGCPEISILEVFVRSEEQEIVQLDQFVRKFSTSQSTQFETVSSLSSTAPSTAESVHSVQTVRSVRSRTGTSTTSSSQPIRTPSKFYVGRGTRVFGDCFGETGEETGYVRSKTLVDSRTKKNGKVFVKALNGWVSIKDLKKESRTTVRKPGFYILKAPVDLETDQGCFELPQYSYVNILGFTKDSGNAAASVEYYSRHEGELRGFINVENLPMYRQDPKPSLFLRGLTAGIKEKSILKQLGFSSTEGIKVKFVSRGYCAVVTGDSRKPSSQLSFDKARTSRKLLDIQEVKWSDDYAFFLRCLNKGH